MDAENTTTTTANATATTANAMPYTLAELNAISELIGASPILGTRNKAETLTVMLICQQEGISYLEFAQRYHLILGKISIKAERMLVNLRDAGGEYRIISRTPDYVALELTYRGNKFTSEIRWENAKSEQFVLDGNGKMKAKYSTPRSRMQMLWARAVSDGVRVICPEASLGQYTPEENADIAEERQSPVAQHQPQVESAQPQQHAESVPLSAIFGTNQNMNSTTQPQPQNTQQSGTVCRMQGQYYGASWDIVPERVCQCVLASAFTPGVTDADREYIKKSLDNRRTTDGRIEHQ